MFAVGALGGARVLAGHAADVLRGGRRDIFGRERGVASAARAQR